MEFLVNILLKFSILLLVFKMNYAVIKRKWWLIGFSFSSQKISRSLITIFIKYKNWGQYDRGMKAKLIKQSWTDKRTVLFQHVVNVGYLFANVRILMKGF